jgi:hypothetical protein
MQSMKGILREILKIIWMLTRYILVCVLVMSGIVSLATGKFPPPFKEVYQNIRGAQASLNIAGSTSQLAKAKADQQKTLNALEQESEFQPNQRSVAQESPENLDQQKIKQLEYEVALLKAKLAHSQWEFRQLQKQQEIQTQPSAQR